MCAVLVIHSQKEKSRINPTYKSVFIATLTGIFLGFCYGLIMGSVIQAVPDCIFFGMSVGAAVGCNFGFLVEHRNRQ
jgi:uncharacterized membrane protein